jgi:hypothetical protein
LACATIAPIVFVALALWKRSGRAHHVLGDVAPKRSFPIAATMTAFGLTLSVLGAMNQLIRRPPFEVDLTLRTGNGGFILLGALLAAVGIALALVPRRE